MAQEYEKLQRRFGFKPTRYAPEPRYNIAPGQTMPVLIGRDGRELALMKWGLVPSWAKEESIGYKMINARSESISEKPSFRKPLQSQRCLVPADAYYEWMKTPGSRHKRPFRFSLKNDEPFGFAGLWDIWKKPDREELFSYTIITTSANDLAKPIHYRMPVVLQPRDEEMWLDCGFRDTDRLVSLLQPYPSSEMKCYEVSTLVNSPRNDSPECMAKLDN